jgi:hypothetical protein
MSESPESSGAIKTFYNQYLMPLYTILNMYIICPGNIQILLSDKSGHAFFKEHRKHKTVTTDTHVRRKKEGQTMRHPFDIKKSKLKSL